MNVLVGKIISALYLAEDKKAIRFDIEGSGPIVARCDGDCCSSTWIESIENPQAAIGLVLEADGIDMPDRGSPNEYEVIAYYGFRIRTAKGDCIIDFRNESNGYYGGYLSWPDSSYFYGGVYCQNVSNQEWGLVK